MTTAQDFTSIQQLAGVENGSYVLPDLPYAYDALEPLYSRQIVTLHHDKHHAKYVRNFNSALEKLQEARKNNDFAAIRSLSRALAFNGSGHVLHTLFWHSMKPGGQAKIPDEFQRAIQQDFGSVEACQAQFAAAAKDVEASGWAILAYEPMANKLLILQAENHQYLTVWGVVPLMVCDVWEHAFYLQYENRKADWVDAFMKIADWEFAAQRYAMARMGSGK